MYVCICHALTTDQLQSAAATSVIRRTARGRGAAPARAGFATCSPRNSRPARHHDVGTGDLPVRGSVVIPAAELSRRFSRSSGPGGQGVNTTDSRAELSYDLATSAALGPGVEAARSSARQPRQPPRSPA
jgi:hypothetical protein